jgi:hypothetical protein
MSSVEDDGTTRFMSGPWRQILGYDKVDLIPRPSGSELWWPLKLPDGIEALDSVEASAMIFAANMLRRKYRPLGSIQSNEAGPALEWADTELHPMTFIETEVFEL